MVIFSICDIHFIRNVIAKQYKLIAQTLQVFFNKMNCSKILKAKFFQSYSELFSPENRKATSDKSGKRFH